MKKTAAVLLCLLMPFVIFFCGCTYGTKLSRLTSLHADDVESVGYSYIAQSMVIEVKKSKYNLFFRSIDVVYEQCDDIYSLIYSDELAKITCFHVAFKDNKRMLLYQLPNKKICVDYNDGKGKYYYISKDV